MKNQIKQDMDNSHNNSPSQGELFSRSDWFLGLRPKNLSITEIKTRYYLATIIPLIIVLFVVAQIAFSLPDTGVFALDSHYGETILGAAYISFTFFACPSGTRIMALILVDPDDMDSKSAFALKYQLNRYIRKFRTNVIGEIGGLIISLLLGLYFLYFPQI